MIALNRRREILSRSNRITKPQIEPPPFCLFFSSFLAALVVAFVLVLSIISFELSFTFVLICISCIFARRCLLKSF